VTAYYRRKDSRGHGCELDRPNDDVLVNLPADQPFEVFSDFAGVNGADAACPCGSGVNKPTRGQLIFRVVSSPPYRACYAANRSVLAGVIVRCGLCVKGGREVDSWIGGIKYIGRLPGVEAPPVLGATCRS